MPVWDTAAKMRSDMGHFPSSGRYSGIFSDRAESGSLSSAFIARYLPAVEVKTVFIVYTVASHNVLVLLCSYAQFTKDIRTNFL